ncbi:MAG: hypothetical protein A2X32_04325 [Elusimicrobia bacterium GWC2_64_44]|nr:MAG: hypothetical protein A2X32_04325 [Elusimicrobia bacterium GWC2_64_44]
MNLRKITASLLALFLACPASALELGELRGALRDSRQAGAAVEIGAAAVPDHGGPPKDDLKAPVLRHLTRAIAFCDKNMDDCNGPDGSIRAFAKGIGGGRCNNRGFNCVGEVLDMCKRQAEDGEITPMYWMACGAMLGKLGERDCAQGRATCAGWLQGATYFSLRASAGCHKSFEKDRERLPRADRNMEAFARVVKRDVKGVYVGHVEGAATAGHHFAWHAVKEGGMIGTEKVLEFAFERLALHGAEAAVGAASLPLLAFSTMMFFHELAASEMNNTVCLDWSHYYNGSYANVAGSLDKMTAGIK